MKKKQNKNQKQKNQKDFLFSPKVIAQASLERQIMKGRRSVERLIKNETSNSTIVDRGKLVDDVKQPQERKKKKNLKQQEEHSSSSEELQTPEGKYKLRKIERKQYTDLLSQGSFEQDPDEEYIEKRKGKKKISQTKGQKLSESDHEDAIEYSKLPNNKQALEKLLISTREKIQQYKFEWFQEQAEIENKQSHVHETSIPICHDVRVFDFKKLISLQMKNAGKLFDVIMMDPPWQLSSSQPSRGVAIAYESLSDDSILNIPVPQLQKEGFIFIWVINAKYSIAAKLMKQWGYSLVDELVWVKRTVNGKIAKGHGFYLQHAKETCLVGAKGINAFKNYSQNVQTDVLWSERRGQSQKPEEIYDLINDLAPNGFFLEIFGRRNNLHSKWVTIGNEI